MLSFHLPSLFLHNKKVVGTHKFPQPMNIYFNSFIRLD